MEKRSANDNGNLVKFPRKAKLSEPALKELLEFFDVDGLLIYLVFGGTADLGIYGLSKEQLRDFGIMFSETSHEL